MAPMTAPLSLQQAIHRCPPALPGTALYDAVLMMGRFHQLQQIAKGFGVHTDADTRSRYRQRTAKVEAELLTLLEQCSSDEQQAIGLSLTRGTR